VTARRRESGGDIPNAPEISMLNQNLVASLLRRTRPHSPATSMAGMALLAIVSTALFGVRPSVAQADRFANVVVEATDLGSGLYLLSGAGGNLGLSIGPDGTFLIDDQFAPLNDKIKAAIARLTDQPVRFVVNTHWHGDHTGGNEKFGEAGAVIVAHDNVRRRMSVDSFSKAFNDSTPASPHAALPVITFAESVVFHLNGQEINVRHTPPAHTDGDAVIHFRPANVIHVGDLFFNGMYPFVDVESGGSIDGYVTVIDAILPMIDDNTRIIPGHGAIATKAEFKAFRDVLADVSQAVKALVADKKSKDEVIAAKPTAKWDAKWGNGFMKPDQFVGLVYDSVTGAQ